MKFRKEQGKRRNEKEYGTETKTSTKPLKFLGCKLNGHYFLVLGQIACSDTNSFDLPLIGNCLLGYCCRVEYQGEDSYSASTEEQAHTFCLQKKSESFTGTVRPEGDATLWEACCVAFHFIKPSPHLWNLTCGRQSIVRNRGDSQCGLSLSPRVLLTPGSTPSPSSCNLFSQISDKFFWLPASLSCTKHFPPSSSSTVLCNCCSKLGACTKWSSFPPCNVPTSHPY